MYRQLYYIVFLALSFVLLSCQKPTPPTPTPEVEVEQPTTSPTDEPTPEPKPEPEPEPTPEPKPEPQPEPEPPTPPKQQVDPSQWKGKYRGDFDTVIMKGSGRDPIKGAETLLSIPKERHISLDVKSFKMGKMPFSVSISAQNIPVKEDGTFFVKDLPKVMHVLLTSYPATVKGSLSMRDGKRHLEYSMETSYLGQTVYIHYVGDLTQ